MNVDMQKDPSNKNFNPDEQEPLEGAQTLSSDDEGEIAGLQQRIKTLEEELLDSKDRYIRQAADMENMRRRQERERSDLLKYGTEKLLQDLLPVLDSLDKALVTQGADSNPILEGIRMVQKQFAAVLENHGLKAIEAAGKPFDPNVHQAIQRVEHDVETDTVKDEYQKGYSLNGRLIRPAMVSVYVPKGPSNEVP